MGSVFSTFHEKVTSDIAKRYPFDVSRQIGYLQYLIRSSWSCKEQRSSQRNSILIVIPVRGGLIILEAGTW
jgi:hypothetical protein